MNFREFLKNNIVVLDGAMGTMLQKNGLMLGQNPEEFNITNKEIIGKIHTEYFESGSNVVYTNTFGANRHKLANVDYSVEDIIKAGVEIAREVADKYKGYVALDVGPIGELLEPMGELSFEDAYDLFKEQVVLGEKYGADLVVVETMTDLQEMRAAVLAVRENTNLPILCTMSFEVNARTFTGCDIKSMALVLEGLGVDGLGINCSLGPAQINPIACELIKYTNLPVVIKANAGLPSSEGKFDSITVEEYAQEYAKYLEMGVSVIGGCCGTNPDYIKAIAKEAKGRKPVERKPFDRSFVCTSSKAVAIDTVRVIGERINPTGKKIFKQALLDSNFDYIAKQAFEQIEAGADILDVNVGLPEIDEPQMMIDTVMMLQSVIDTPLQIDSSDPKALEAALRIYNGKAIVNSVNGEEDVLDSILPIVKKYGASVVGLTLDQNGIPKTGEERFKIAEYILKKAESYGIKKQDVFIDCLTLTVSAEQDKAKETLKAIRLVKEKLGLNNVLGVSNISFGLPQRENINTTFLACAMQEGLTLPIINPNNDLMMSTVRAFRVLSNYDKNSVDYIECYGNVEVMKSSDKTKDIKEMNLTEVIIKGLSDECVAITLNLLENNDEIVVVNEHLIPALDVVGQLFETNKIFLPQLIKSAETAKLGFDEVKKKLITKGVKQTDKGKIVLATVKGDIHDIGKNIVKVVLENYGYKIIDLGRDVEIDKVIQSAKQYEADIVGLSALMTTTVKSMEKTIKALKENGLTCKTMVGGAVMTEDYAKKIGADYYAKDANESVRIVKEILGN